MTASKANTRAWIATLFAMLFLASTAPAADSPVIHSVKSGPWSDPATWSDKKVPGEGARVLIRAYDANTAVWSNWMTVAPLCELPPTGYGPH